MLNQFLIQQRGRAKLFTNSLGCKIICTFLGAGKEGCKRKGFRDNLCDNQSLPTSVANSNIASPNSKS